MRRVLAVVVGVVGAAPALAEPAATNVTLEGGAEADTNVQRVESRPGQERIAAAVGRLGGKLDTKGKLAGGTYTLQVQGLARLVGSTTEAQSESIGFGIGDVRWVHPLGARPVSAGFAVTAADASALTAEEPDSRTFRNLGADGLLVLRGTPASGGDALDRTLGFAAGVRSFTYKPNHNFDWVGPVANVRLDATLWQQSGGTRSVELAAFAGIEARAYDSVALVDAPCPPGVMFEGLTRCPAATSLPRRDRYHRIGAEVTWVGRVVAALGYQVTVTDSNSFGQSLVRHRVNLLATTDLPGQLYLTALATVQLDQYLDGLIVQQDILNQTFSTIEDENRSSLQGRLARPLTETWSIEARAAIWRDLELDNNTTFRRALFYLGAVYNH